MTLINNAFKNLLKRMQERQLDSAAFESELGKFSEALNSRISAEESTLYPLYNKTVK